MGEPGELTRSLADWVEGLGAEETGKLTIPIEGVKVLVPIARPPKILLWPGTTRPHVIRAGRRLSGGPRPSYVFMKPPTTTLTHPGDPVIIPKCSPDHIDYEAELGVVIGRRRVEEGEALEYVAGYTIVNDITDGSTSPTPTGSLAIGTSSSTGCTASGTTPSAPSAPACSPPMRCPTPGIPHPIDRQPAEAKQDGSTGQMIFPVAAVIAFLSKFVTLEPGDLISTGALRRRLDHEDLPQARRRHRGLDRGHRRVSEDDHRPVSSCRLPVHQ